MTLIVAPIVEGHTEQQCLERLLHRIWGELLGATQRLQILSPPSRGHRDRLVAESGADLAEKTREAVLKLESATHDQSDTTGLLLVLLDADHDCPAALAPRLLKAVRALAPADIHVACVLPKKEFENWIVAGASSLTGVNGLPTTLPAVRASEDIKGSNWIEKQLRIVARNRRYKKTVDPIEVIRRMNLSDARANSPSFDKLCRELEKRLPPPPPPVTEGDAQSSESTE